VARPKVPGLYVIADLTEQMAYVGSSNDLDRRTYDHQRMLKRNDHHNWGLQRAHQRGNELVCLRIPTLPDVNPLEVEQVVLNELFPEGTLYNVSKDTSAPTLGMTFGPETRLKVSLAGTGRKCSPETILKMKEASKGRNAGRTLSEEHKAKLSAAFTGRVISEKQKQQISNHFKGKPLSEEHHQKVIANGKLQQKPVVCAGLQYPGFKEAARTLGIPHSTINSRFESKSEKFKDWYRLPDQQE